MLWFTSGDTRLSADARAAIEKPDTISYISIASWWEMAIKCSLDKLQLDLPIKDFIAQRVDEGFRVLSIGTDHMPVVATLPFHHRDPFDRLIISQAIIENMPICTSDAQFDTYDIQRIW